MAAGRGSITGPDLLRELGVWALMSARDTRPISNTTPGRSLYFITALSRNLPMSVKQCFHERVRVKFGDVCGFFTQADKLYGDIELVFYCDYYSTASGSVEFG